LFHGELLQGFESVERYGEDGIEGTIRTLPRDELLRSHSKPEFVGDPILLDVAMHPVVAWHLEQADQSGRIMLPFELNRLAMLRGFVWRDGEAGEHHKSAGGKD